MLEGRWRMAFVDAADCPGRPAAQQLKMKQRQRNNAFEGYSLKTDRRLSPLFVPSDIQFSRRAVPVGVWPTPTQGLAAKVFVKGLLRDMSS